MHVTSGPAHEPAIPAEPLVSVVIPARDEQGAIERAVRSVQRQSYGNLQIIVVDGGSVDRTVELTKALAAEDARVEILHNPAGIIPRSLNLALAAARGMWLVRVDAHATVPVNYVERIVEHFRSADWGGVGGRKDGVGTGPVGEAIAAAMASRFGVGNSTYHYATEPAEAEHIPFGAYPVALARELGGWDERLRVNQDFEFDFRVRRAGYKLLLDPDLSISWESRQSIGALYSQYLRYGRGKAKVAGLHPSSVRARHLTAPTLVAGLAAALLSARRRPSLAALLTGPYLAGVGLATIRTAPKVSPRARPYLPASFVAMHVGWGLGFWRGLPDLVAMLRSGSRPPAAG
jgi:cellulose synthase/poly-beta-1,6-N-acetylglucosamine synthase-like glycosyltransferase